MNAVYGTRPMPGPTSPSRHEGIVPSPAVHSADGDRPTLAFFSASLGPNLYYEKWQMWDGIAQVARACDANVLYIAGGNAHRDPASVLYDLVDAGTVDGILAWTGVVLPDLSPEAACAFLAGYQPVQVVNVGWRIPGIPSLSFDHSQGAQSMVEHLVRVHGYRRIAYVGRQPHHAGMEERYTGYETTLAQHGLFDPSLVVEGPNQPGIAVLRGRNRLPGRDYQAVMAAEDGTAAALIQELQDLGLRVPDDVAVVGYHDAQEARISVPPLTTVRMPYREAGRRAARMLFGLIQGSQKPAHSFVPVEMVVRQSCGCPDARVTQAGPGIHSRAKSPDVVAIGGDRERLLAEVVAALGTPGTRLDPEWADRLLDSFLADLAAAQTGAGPGQFTRELNRLLHDFEATGANIMAWQNALSALRRGLLARVDGPARPVAEDIWHQARVITGQAAARAEAKQVWRLLHSAQTLHELEAAFHIAFDLETMLGALLAHLPRLGIAHCYLALYDDPAHPDSSARLILAYDERGRLPLPAAGLLLPSRQLLPPILQPTGRCCSLAVQALHFWQEQIGFLVLEIDPAVGMALGTTYETLRSQISSALKGLRLHREIEEARQKAEEANALKSRFLSMVSHELRTPLSLIIGLCEMASWEQTRLPDGNTQALLDVLTRYQGQIYHSAQHLDRLIRDVLDLASSQVGQLKLTRTPLDLVHLLQEVAAEGKHMAREKRLAWRAEIPDVLPLISGDVTRLRQVLLNLLSNSVKFTARGEVVLQAEADDAWVRVSVGDTGLGIPRDQQGTIFDEFQHAQRPVGRAYGGMGLGLALTRRLVESHGGRIWVQSAGEEGQGSTFTFSLPVLAPEHVHLPSPGRQPPEPEVLLLTQRPGEHGPLHRHLAACGYRVTDASLDGSKGWLVPLLDHPVGAKHPPRPSAVLLDLAPSSDQAWEIVRTLKEHPTTEDLPVLFCSLLYEQGRSGLLALDYLQKPVGSSELASALARHGLDTATEDETPTVLVVDDEPGLANVHARIVRNQIPGCRVLTALNGRDALALIREKLPDLVLLDLLMPDLDGFAVLEEMQAGEMTRTIPVIVLTGQSLDHGDMARLSHGVAAVLGKGLFTVEETLVQIEAALARTQGGDDPARRLARQAMAFIQAHFAEPITRSDIARHLGLSERYFNRCFRQETGIPPMVYLNRCRIRQAQKLLMQTDKSVTDIAMSVGYSSSSYFSRMFQRETGVSPTAFRRGKRGTTQATI